MAADEQYTHPQIDIHAFICKRRPGMITIWQYKVRYNQTIAVPEERHETYLGRSWTSQSHLLQLHAKVQGFAMLLRLRDAGRTNYYFEGSMEAKQIQARLTSNQETH